MADPLFINDLIVQITNGNIRIPSFQRGFVWDADRVAHLMDSIYKGYPFGSLLFWRTKTPLSSERTLGPFDLPDKDPDYPVDYILDGQQRATSIFGVFQTVLTPKSGSDSSWTRIYFDLSSTDSAQDSRFRYIPDEELNEEIHFPLRILFDSAEYRNFLKNMRDDIAEDVDQLYRRFTTAKIPIQTFATDDRAAVAIVFERINRLGVELDTLQLLSAWSWSDDFDLQDNFSDLAEDLEPFGFSDVGEDSDLLLRCCSAIIENDASPSTIINLKGREVTERFAEIKTGILGAVDYLRSNLRVGSARILPYTNIIIPLSVFFATTNDQSTNPSAEQQKILTNWIWRTFFTRRYSKRLEQLNQDIVEIIRLKENRPSNLGRFKCMIDKSFFTTNTFSVRNMNAKTFILMLINSAPLNFLSGSPVALEAVLRDCNKKEFHHVYPKSYLSALGIGFDKIDCLANFCVIARAENNKISNRRPSEYRKLMPASDEQIHTIMERAVCPKNIFHDNFEKFIEERSQMLAERANNLMGVKLIHSVLEQVYES